MTKGAVSTAVTKALPPAFSYWCRGCKATHIYEQLMRVATIHGGVRLVAGASPATLAPLERRGQMRTKPDVSAATAVVEKYLRINGPATLGDAAGFVGTATSVVKRTWPENLAWAHAMKAAISSWRTWISSGSFPAALKAPRMALMPSPG